MLPSHLYFKAGLRQGVDLRTLEAATSERRRQLAQGAFPILTLGHLAKETGASYNYLREVVTRSRDPYRALEIPKRTGGARAISAPEPILMEVQRWILGNVLSRQRTSPHSFAYMRGVSIVDCARMHVGATWLLKVDLHSFFDSVSESNVYRVYRRLGYPKLVSIELARICTRAEGATLTNSSSAYSSITSYSTTPEGVLPQGGPTSGILANAVAARLDRLAGSFSRKSNLVYTRYSDDLTFSSAAAFDRSRVEDILGVVTNLVHAAGFSLHRSKTRIVPPGARRVVLGLLVDDDVRLLPKNRRRIEEHLRGVEKFGLAEHAAYRKFESAVSFVNHLDGWISFAKGVESVRATEWRKQFNTLLASEGVPIYRRHQDGI